MKITLDHIYYLTGIALLVFTAYTLLDKNHKAKYGTALFWGLFGLTFLFGSVLPPVAVGVMVVVMAIIAGAKWMGTGKYNEAERPFRLENSVKFKNWLFGPALAIPIITFLIGKYTTMGALVGFGLGAIVSYALTMILTRETVGQSFNEGRRLLDSISWALILPQVLAALGFLFDKAGVGKEVARIVTSVVPTESMLATVIAYCVGMALFTMIMGNAFAAFAVITSGIGIPLVIKLHGADPAIAGVIAMVSGYCGTLMTPMAANFNIVPAVLLEMKDEYGVIKAQIMTALPLLVINIMLMYFLAFPGGK